MPNLLLKMVGLMEAHFGPAHWWPGESPFEIAVGAVLTQNTAWANVERAIANLKHARLLHPKALLQCDDTVLEEALHPSGYFRVKTKRLKNFCAYLVDGYGGSMARMAKRPLEELRAELLGVNGIGPETADDILLYACNKPIFVVDAYTRRILSRHGLVSSDIRYRDLQKYVMRRLDLDRGLFAEYHGLIVWTGKEYCRKSPKCSECPLGPLLKRGQPLMAPPSRPL